MAARRVQRWARIMSRQFRTALRILTRMQGLVALVGSGEFLAAMSEIDAGLLAATGRRRPRVALLAGCSAGAMTLAGRHWDLRGRRLFWPLRWRTGLGIVPGATIIPHYDAWPEAMSALLVLQAPRGLPILGIDEE